MTPGEAEHDELVMKMVESALALPEAEREGFLRAQSELDAATIEEIRTLMEWEERMRGFLSEPLLSARELVDRPFEPGQTMAGRFRIVRQVGDGGMGIVYQAVDEKLDRTVALKCARLGYSTRLPPEARAAREVSHYNVCKVHDLHTVKTVSGEVEVISMEYVEGETLAARLRTRGPLGDSDMRDIAAQICAGVAQAHRQGVIHGDLKPSNIILARSAEGGLRAVVTDFGLASLSQTAVRALGGTKGYMAPELLQRAPATVASDLYALGVMLYEMCTGTQPKPRWADSTTRSKGDPEAESSALELAELHAPWHSIVTRCLRTNPAERYASALEILQELEPKKFSAWWIAAPLTITALASLLYVRWHEPPEPPKVRLAVMPVQVQGPAIVSANGVLRDVVSRLERAKANVIVISPEALLANKVDSPAKARAVLGATHALTTTLRREDDRVQVESSLSEIASDRNLETLKSVYPLAEPQAISKALLATVTGGLRLRTELAIESVNAAAYGDYIQGTALSRARKWDEALPFLRRAQDLDRHSALPLVGVAEAQLQKFDNGDGRKWLDSAGVLIDRAIAINPDSVPVLLAAGKYHKLRGSYEEAAREFTRASELEPSNSETWGGLAALYGEINRPDEAVAAFQKAIAAQPDYYAHYIGLGSFYLYRAQYQDAADAYRRLLKIAPDNSSARIGLGIALLLQGQFQQAETELTAGYRLDPSPLAALNLGVLYYSEERYPDALRFLQQGLTKEPDAVTYKDLGDVYRKLGRKADSQRAYQNALATAEREVALSPRNSYSRAMIGEVSAFLGNRRRAEFELAQALALNPGNALVKFEAAIAYEQMGERDRSLNLLANAPSYLLGQISRSPDAKQLRQDPRFQDLLRKP